jgi:DNA-binding CsgD family transcriptional regulator
MGDCLLSLQRGAERGEVYVLMAFRAAVSAPPEGGANPGIDVRAAANFSPRERLLVDTLHRGLDWLYRAEETFHRLNRAAALPPRLRQTLEYLLSGDTERQVALKMSLSVHTVHDYVKALHSHFGVSSRTELLARWLQTGGQIPLRRDP